MRKLIFIFIFTITLLIIATIGAINTANAATPDNNFPIQRFQRWENSQLKLTQELYTAIKDGQIWYREIENGFQTIDRPANTAENILYGEYLVSLVINSASKRLRGEIEGEKVVNWLRNRAIASQNASDNWDSWNNTQKTNATKILFRDLGKLLTGLADVIESEGFDQ